MKVFREVVEDALRELLDEPYQRVVWRASGGPEVSCFDECICRLFDDSGLGDALDRGTPVFTSEIDAQFRQLGVLLSKVDARRTPDVVLDDPSVVHARSLASTLLQEVRDVGFHEGG